MPSRNLVRHATDYPPVYFQAAKRIALKAAPTLDDKYDDPPRAGPFKRKSDIGVYRATWHNFRELLRTNGNPSSPATAIYRIIMNLTTRTVSDLQPDGSELFWLEFAPHPFVVDEWRNNPEAFAAEQRRHALFVERNAQPPMDPPKNIDMSNIHR